MSTLNQVIIEGNAVRDAQEREKPWGTKFAVLTLASNRYYKDKKGGFAEEVGFYDVHVYGDGVLDYLYRNAKKGAPIRVIGRLRQERWDGKDGKRVTRNYIVAQHIDFLKKVKAEGGAKSEEDKKKILENLASSYSGILNQLGDSEESITASEEEATF